MRATARIRAAAAHAIFAHAKYDGGKRDANKEQNHDIYWCHMALPLNTTGSRDAFSAKM